MWRRDRSHAVLMALALALVLSASANCMAYEEVAVYVDGKQVDFVSGIVSTGRMPALLVEGHPMVAARFISEVLKEPLDLHLWWWGIMRIGNLSFNPGCEYALEPVPMVGGSVPCKRELPLAPRMMKVADFAHFYVPAIPTLAYLGHKAEWQAEAKLLRITAADTE